MNWINSVVKLYSWSLAFPFHKVVQQQIWGEVVVLIKLFLQILSEKKYEIWSIFTRATICVSAVFSVVRCLSVCPSVTLVDCIHMAEDIVKLLSRPGSPIILVIWLPAPVPNSMAILITKTKTRTKMIAIRLLKLILELKYSKKLKLYKNYIDSWLNKLKLEINNTENWNELKHLLVHVIFHVIYFKRDRLKRNFGQPRHLHYFRCSTIIRPTEV